jgi:lysophospholipase L1-like esterase
MDRPWLAIAALAALFSITAPIAMSASTDPSAAGLRVSANAPVISYEGRTATDSAGAVRLGFPGVATHLHFRGTGVNLRANASSTDVCFDISIDGTTPVLLQLKKGVGVYPLAHDLALVEHTIVLTRRTESWEGVCTLESFELAAGGEWLAAPSLPTRKLMFIGDSVTCGAMAAWVPEHEQNFTALDNSGAMSYGMVLARRLGAQCYLVSYGGRGIIRDWQGIRDTRNAPQFYELALPDEPETFWDHRRYVADAIGIQLGTNDFSQGIPDENEFVNGYVEFIRKVHRDAPAAWIVVMYSPIVNDDDKGPRRTALNAYLAEIVHRVQNDHVVLAPLQRYPGVPHNGHPTGPEHEAMANELEPVFRTLLGW